MNSSDVHAEHQEPSQEVPCWQPNKRFSEGLQNLQTRNLLAAQVELGPPGGPSRTVGCSFAELQRLHVCTAAVSEVHVYGTAVVTSLSVIRPDSVTVCTASRAWQAPQAV